MKISRIFLVLAYLMVASIIIGQTPIGFNYQAVARNSDGSVLKNTNIEVSFIINNGDQDIPDIWQEKHNLTTDALGSFSLVIGADPDKKTGGSAENFSVIDWGADNYFLEVLINEESMGISQLMSVPYAALAQDVVNLPESVWSQINGDIVFNDGNVSIGSETANSRLTVQGDPASNIDTALFEVKNIDGVPVFAVYNEGVRIYIDDTNVKGIKGGFAIGGYNSATKGLTNEYMRVTPDSVRVWVNESSAKGVKGGFAIGGYNSATKSTPASFLQLDPENYFIGHEAGLNNVEGRYNSFFGYQAGYENLNGDQNIFIGYNSGYSNTSGSLNTFIGNRTGFTNTTGFANVFIGDSSGYHNVDGQWNVFVGEGTGIHNINGKSNVFIGDKAGRNNEAGSKNVFLGNIAGWKNIDGFSNVFIGTSAGSWNISGSDNTIMGSYSGKSNTTGNANIFIGKIAGYNNTSGSDNIYIGAGAGYQNDTTHSNIFIGNNSGENNTAGYGNIYLGNRSGADIIDGSNNTILGHESAHFKTHGSTNTYIGAYAGHENTDGYRNVFLGANAGFKLENGYDNTILGEAAGYNMKGNSNVFIGSSAGYNESGSNKLYIENTATDSSLALMYGDFEADYLTINGRLGINSIDPLGDFQVSSNNTWAKMFIGIPDSIVGYAEFAGSASGSNGGSLRLGTSADFDDVNDFWQIKVFEENFQIGSQNEVAFFEITKDGEIIHKGTSIHADYVFDESFPLETIEEHAAFMWENKHLLAVPPANVDKNGNEVVNLGARNKGVLEELEKAHIYIEQLNDALKNQEAMILELKKEMDSLKAESR